jgi:hypothetical protein
MSLPIRGVRAKRENVARIGKGILFLLKMSPEQRTRLSAFNLFIRLIFRSRIRPRVCHFYKDFRHYEFNPVKVHRFDVRIANDANIFNKGSESWKNFPFVRPYKIKQCKIRW